MKLQQWLFLFLFALTLSQRAVAIDESEVNYQSRFENMYLKDYAEVTYYNDKALLLDIGDRTFIAFFLTVEDPFNQEICGYGVGFRDGDFNEFGNHQLSTRYYCQEQFQPYDGDFYKIIRRCSTGFSCPSPAVGVGNLIVKPLEISQLMSQPSTLEVDIQGTIWTGF